MNLIQLSENLKNLADHQLVGEMQSPTGMAPPYLVLSELKRRKTMRADALKNPQPTSTPLSQEIPQQLAGLDSAAMNIMQQRMQPQTNFNPQSAQLPQGQPQSYAAGGLVSFAGGGTTDPYPAALQNTAAYKALYGQPGIEGFPSWLMKTMVNAPDHPMSAIPKGLYPEMFGGDGPSVPSLIPSAQAAGPGLPSVQNQMGDELAAGAPPVPENRDPKTDPRVNSSAGIGAWKRPDMASMMAEMEKYSGKAEERMTPEQAAQERITMNKQFGVDQPALTETEKRLHDMESGIQERKGERVGLALLGLGGRMMAGKSQYALTNIGEAIPPTLKDDADFMKELHTMQKDALGVQATVEQARRLEAKGNADAAMKILEDNRGRIEKFYERRAQVAGQIGSHIVSGEYSLAGHQIQADAMHRSGIAYLFDQWKADPRNKGKGLGDFMGDYGGAKSDASLEQKALALYDGPNGFMLKQKYPTFQSYLQSLRQGGGQSAGTFNPGTGQVE